MIVVIGRAHVGAASRFATALAARGGKVELVGSVTDDEPGDQAIVRLGRAGVGHAAVLRDPLARLDAPDIELGLRYLPGCRVVLLTDALDEGAQQAVVEAAAFHEASIVALASEGQGPMALVALVATVLESRIDLSAEEGGSDAFVDLVAGVCLRLDAGDDAGSALREAVATGGWERSVDD